MKPTSGIVQEEGSLERGKSREGSIPRYKANGATPASPTASAIPDIIAALIPVVAGASKFTATQLQNTGVLSPGVTQFFQGQAIDGTRPKAYLNWVLLDEHFKFVAGSSGSDQVPAESQYLNNTSNPQVFVHTKPNLSVSKNGYLYIYVSNETTNINVFFDNLQVTHVRGPLLEENNYYPFGLQIPGISSKALGFGGAENRRKFNGGNELQSKEFSDGSGLETYDAHFRMYDPQIGRFMQIDAMDGLSQSMSLYAFGNNNPILLNDPLGLLSTKENPQVLQEVIVRPKPKSHLVGFYWNSNYTAKDVKNQTNLRGEYFQQRDNGQNPKNAKFAPYRGSFEKQYQSNKEWKTNSITAVLLIASPILIATSPAQISIALTTQKLKAVGIDAGVQTVVNAMQHKNIFSNYNIVSGLTSFAIGAPEGASLSQLAHVNLLSSAVGTSLNVSYNSLTDPSASMISFDPRAIIINAIFGTAAGKYSQFIGQGSGAGDAFGDGAASPIIFAGAVSDEATKSKEQ